MKDTTRRQGSKSFVAHAGPRPEQSEQGPQQHGEPPQSKLRRYGNIVLALALLFIFIHGIFGPHGALAAYQAKQNVRRLQKEIDKLKQQNQQLADQVKALKFDSATIEGIARGMGLARPGELIFKVPGNTEQGGTLVQPAGAGTSGSAPQGGSVQPQPK